VHNEDENRETPAPAEKLPKAERSAQVKEAHYEACPRKGWLNSEVKEKCKQNGCHSAQYEEDRDH